MSRLICILGGSGTGKTVLAGQLAAQIGCSVVGLDDVRAELQHEQPTAENLILIDESSYFKFAPEELIGAHRALSQRVCDRAWRLIGQLYRTEARTILEGDDLTADLVLTLRSHNMEHAAVCLYEENGPQIAENIVRRDPTVSYPLSVLMKRQLEHAHRNGRRIAAECREIDVPVIPARPFTTLVSRTRKAIHQYGALHNLSSGLDL